MPRTCTVCGHPRRPAIDAALLAGEPFRHIASRFDTSTAALQRHKAEHLPVTLSQAREAVQVAQADDLLGQLRELQAKALDLLAKAERAGDYRTALAGIREARNCIETLLEVEGELDRRNVVNVTISAEWLQLRAVIIGALEDHPEARQAVVERLQVIEGGGSRAAD